MLLPRTVNGFRMLVPSGVMTDEGASATIRRFMSWFGDADSCDVEVSSADEVEGRAALTYRFRLHNANGWQLIGRAPHFGAC
jgi:hypothetical protein